MAVEHRAASGTHERRGGLRRSRWFWPLWTLAAFLLLALSQALWLWHSWPVRELLALEQAAGGFP